jgi:transposase-like protein
MRSPAQRNKPAVLAMAVTHLQRIAAHLDLNRSTVTLTSMRFGHRLFDDGTNATGFARLL